MTLYNLSETNFFLYIFFILLMNFKKYKINMNTWPHISFFIAYIYTDCFDCFLTFRYKIIIYSLYSHELFLNFLMWDNYTTLHICFYNLHSLFLYSFYLYALFFNFFLFMIIIYSYIHMNYFLIFQCGIIILHFIFFFIIYIHMNCFLNILHFIFFYSLYLH
jgi:hypothetical protein